MGLSIRINNDSQGENFLLLIGIDKYISMQSLSNCVKDIKGFAEVLTTRYTFKYENIVLLTNEQATRENIYKAFLELISKLNHEDSIIIYYAGLGYYTTIINEAYLIPVDGNWSSLQTCIELTVIEKWLNAFKAKHVVFISDSDKSFNLMNYGYRTYETR